MSAMVMLIRREFWEHRMLTIAPLTLCILYLGFCALAGANINVRVIQFGDQAPASGALMIVLHALFTALLYGLMAVVAFFYLCDCLYAERKDRTILFWKSLPVSDTKTVLSKLIVALIAIPLVVYVLSLVTNLLAFGLFKLIYHGGSAGRASDWSLLGWLRLNGYLLIDVFVLALWFSPIAAYQLFVSVLVPRTPFVFTLLPPLALTFGEALFLGTWNVAHYLGYRLGANMFEPRTSHGIEGLIDSVNALPLLERPGLWIGAAVAAALVFVTIRIRRHRDDT